MYFVEWKNPNGSIGAQWRRTLEEARQLAREQQKVNCALVRIVNRSK